MSIKLMTAVFDRYPNGGAEKLLALAIADAADPDGSHIFKSVERFASMSTQSERSVQRQIREMLESGWLVLVRKSSGRRGEVTEYCISPEWVNGGDPVPPGSVPDRRTTRRRTGDKVSPVAGSAERPTGDIAVSPVKPHLTGDTQGLSGDTQGLWGDTAVSPNPSLPFITHNPQPPPGGECGFNEVAAQYPKQVDMEKARARWRKLAPDHQLQGEISRAIQAWTRSPEWQRDEGRWIPKFSNWLRGERWKDQPGVAGPPPPPAPPPEPRALAAPMPEAVREQVNKILGRRRGDKAVQSSALSINPEKSQ